MPKTIELRPVDHITTDAIGPAGQRVFYIQAWKEERIVAVIVEKVQVQSLAVAIEQFLAELNTKHVDLPNASAEFDEAQMHIHPPVDAIFRAAEIGLGYDAEQDLVALELREGVESPEATSDDMYTARLWCTRSQLRSMANWGIEIASRGRPTCPQCGEPMDPAGHFCVKKNGHKH